MPTKNVVRSTLVEDLWVSGTTITITAGEWSLFEAWVIATIEQFNSEWKATAREVVVIQSINWNVLTLIRWYEKCVMDDTATPKELWNTAQSFTAWAKISVYISKSLLVWVQARLKNYNKPCNDSVYCQAMDLTDCILSQCDCWWDKLLSTKACCCYNDKWFWSGCDWDCVMSWNVFLCANREYEFNNLTIQEWALVRFEWQGIPLIRVKRCFCNMGTIDLRGWTFVGCCSITEKYTNTTISNNADQTSYNCMRYGCWGSWKDWGCVWWNATVGCWWDWWDAQNGCASTPRTLASWYNWWNWATWDSCARNNWRCWSWWWWWGYHTGNGWNWWSWYHWSTSDNYAMDWWDWWDGWNAWIWWRWGDWWYSWTWYASWCGWDWGNGYIGWDWWSTNWWKDCMGWYTWKWGNWVILWGAGGNSFKAFWNWWGDWWNAINNMYWFILYACSVYNNIICSKWGQWGCWGCDTLSRCYARWWWDWGCWANWGCVVIWYYRGITQWIIDITWWAWGCWGYAPHWTYDWDPYDYRGCPWADWCPWSYKTCKMF